MCANKKATPPKVERTQPNGATYYVFANQKEVCVKRPKVRSPFFQIDEKYLWNAMQELNGGEFKMYCYLASNKNGYRFALSPKSVQRVTGMTKCTYENAVKGLVEKGYLIQYKDKNYYHFVLDPTLRNDMSIGDYLEWCDKTNEADYQWTDDDERYYNQNEDGWKSDKFEYYYD